MIDMFLKFLGLSLPFSLTACLLSYIYFMWKEGESFWGSLSFLFFAILSGTISIFICGFVILKAIG